MPDTIANARSRRVKVLTAIGGLNRGGAETWLLNMVNRIDRERFQMDVLVDADSQDAYTPDFIKAGCRILRCAGYQQPWQYFTNLKRLYAENGPYDILHSHVHYYSGVVLAIGHWLNIPVRIAHVHPAVDLKPPSWKRTIYRELMFASLRRSATHLLTPSQTSLDAAIAQGRYKMPCRRIIYNGIDLAAYDKRVDRNDVRRRLGLPLAVPLISYVARFCRHKNHRQVLRVAERLNSGGKLAHFVIAGSHGEELEHLKQSCSQRTDVSMLIGLDDITELLMASDVFVFPSLEEGFGIVALEAQAAGLPVIASDLDAIREACAPSHQNLMFQPNNDDACSSQLKRVLESPELRNSLSSDGREWVRNFSVEASLSSLVEVYNSALAEIDVDSSHMIGARALRMEQCSSTSPGRREALPKEPRPFPVRRERTHSLGARLE
jgi:glycosyltransferase involved in cell wall biosynthesis